MFEDGRKICVYDFGVMPKEKKGGNITIVRVLLMLVILLTGHLLLHQSVLAKEPKAFPFFALCMDTHDAKHRN
jgi:hypothetical protein